MRAKILWVLTATLALTACAAHESPYWQDREELPQERILEEQCPDDHSVIFACGNDTCAFYRVDNRLRGQVVPTRGAAVFAPPSGGAAMRWWGSAQGIPEDREPVFVIPWKQPPRLLLLPSELARAEELATRPHEKHHILPQAMQPWFEKRGIDIHKYTLMLLVEDHRRIHDGPRGGPWNAAWRKFILEHPNATQEEIFRHAGELLFRFELVGHVYPYY
jgi:uncharacterized lipoprotein (TIGR02269 family)